MMAARKLLSARLVLDIQPPAVLADASDRRGNDDAWRNVDRLPGHRQRARQAAVSCINVGDLAKCSGFLSACLTRAKMFRLRRLTETPRWRGTTFAVTSPLAGVLASLELPYF